MLKCPVIAVVETYADANITPRRALVEPFQLTGKPGSRLFDEHMLSRIDRGTDNLCKHVMRRSNDDRLHLCARYDLPPVRAMDASVDLRSNFRCTRRIRIDTVEQPGTGQMLGSAPANHPTAHDCDIQSLLPHPS